MMIKGIMMCTECQDRLNRSFDKIAHQGLYETARAAGLFRNRMPPSHFPSKSEGRWQALLCRQLERKGKRPICEYAFDGQGKCDVFVKGNPAEIYEVKQSLDKMTLGQAIGQLRAYQYGLGCQAKLYLAVPDTEFYEIESWMNGLLHECSVELFAITEEA
jgi:hypothetical protein